MTAPETQPLVFTKAGPDHPIYMQGWTIGSARPHSVAAAPIPSGTSAQDVAGPDEFQTGSGLDS